MAGSYAPIYRSIWQDPDFLALSADAQRLYLLVVSQPNINWCGVLSYTPKRWARMAPDSDLRSVEAACEELKARRFVVVDDETEELWVRSFVKHNRVLEVPNVHKAMVREFTTILSPGIRRSMIEGSPDGIARALTAVSGGSLVQPSPTLPGMLPGASAQAMPEPSPEPSPEPIGEGQARQSGVGVGVGVGVVVVPSSCKNPPPHVTQQGPLAVDHRVEEEEEPTIIEVAAIIVADRKLRHRSPTAPTIVNQHAWVDEVAHDVEQHHHDQALAWLDAHPTATALQLADHLEPGLAPPPPARILGCDRDGCVNGWIPDPDDDTSVIPCPTCRPEATA